eukprot:2129962-Pyramimonas_sp.AAC.1
MGNVERFSFTERKCPIGQQPSGGPELCQNTVPGFQRHESPLCCVLAILDCARTLRFNVHVAPWQSDVVPKHQIWDFSRGNPSSCCRVLKRMGAALRREPHVEPETPSILEHITTLYDERARR